VGLAVTGVTALGFGGYALWHGWTLQLPDDADPEEHSRSRHRYLLVGTVLLNAGLFALIAAQRTAEGS
jgi:hypothetical protein